MTMDEMTEREEEERRRVNQDEEEEDELRGRYREQKKTMKQDREVR